MILLRSAIGSYAKIQEALARKSYKLVHDFLDKKDESIVLYLWEHEMKPSVMVLCNTPGNVQGLFVECGTQDPLSYLQTL